MVYRSARFPAIILLDRSRTRELRAKSVFFQNQNTKSDSACRFQWKSFFFQDRAFNLRLLFRLRNECTWLIWSYVMPDGNQVYKRCKYIYWLHFIFHFRKKKKVFATISYIWWSKTEVVLTLTLTCEYGSLFRTRLPKFLGHATAKSLRPRRDSNSQSSDSKSDALSIRPRGLSNTFGQNRT